MGCRIRQIFAWLLLVGAIVLGILSGLGLFNASPAMAALRQLEEAPGQVVYQSRQTLKDQHGNSWQAIAFKRVYANGENTVELRLVGFPGVTEIDHSQPLTLTTSLGKTLTLTDISSHIFTENTPLQPNISQYDLQPLLPELQTGIPLKLTLPMMNHQTVNLKISPALVEEWQTVSNYPPNDE